MNKKYVLKIAIVLIIIAGLYLVFTNKIIIELNHYDYSYPERGFIPDEENAIEISKIYLKKHLFIDEPIENVYDLYAVFDDKSDVWKVKSKLPERLKNEIVTDGGITIILRKKDGKIEYFSLYNDID